MTRLKDAITRVQARGAEHVNPEDAEAAKKDLIRSVTTDREAVFA